MITSHASAACVPTTGTCICATAPQLRAVVAATAQVFGRAIVMPNLQAAGHDDRRGGARIASASAQALPPGSAFEPLMTLYLTDDTSADGNRAREGERVRARGQVLPGGRDDEFRIGRDGARARLPGAGGDGARTASCCRSTAKSPIPTSTCSTASACSSSAQLAAIVRDFPGPAHRARAHHDARRPSRS